MQKVIVVGGGAAGIMAAIAAAKKGNDVTLFEKNDKIGKKIYITGKGRCNLTNIAGIENLMENIPTNAHFLYSAFRCLDSEKTIALFNSWGLPTKVERGGRVFPVSDKASDVVAVLEKTLKDVTIMYHSPVSNVIVENQKAVGVMAKGKKFSADKVILATGGLSYESTGSTGDGYRFAKNMGHTITKLYPSLVPLRAKESFVKEVMGLSLKNVAVNLKNQKGKLLYKDFGEMIFTHFGVSGPVVLSASAFLKHMQQEHYLFIDLKPALDEKTLDARILRDFEKYKNKDFKNSLYGLLPQKIIPVIIQLSNIDPNKKVNEITKKERKTLANIVKNLKVTITGAVGFSHAVITSGGVLITEVSPKTMESKIIKNLFLAGEILDVDAYTGGFNLQIAFSTGYLAGTSV